jgi:hypothetical protein
MKRERRGERWIGVEDEEGLLDGFGGGGVWRDCSF